nr:MAG TPA: hypothetical protein [Caudoviricetes sp.]
MLYIIHPVLQGNNILLRAARESGFAVPYGNAVP